MPEDKRTSFNFSKNPILYGTLGALMTGLVGTLILSIVFYYTSLSESYLDPAGTFLYLTCAFLGGFLASRRAGNRGIMYGCTTGLSYFLIVSLIFLLISPQSLSISSVLLKGIYTLIVGAAGGVIGITFTD
ncbi:MAG: TIGR04086 family membrane protein [Thermacetogeniaceae bacterium]